MLSPKLQLYSYVHQKVFGRLLYKIIDNVTSNIFGLIKYGDALANFQTERVDLATAGEENVVIRIKMLFNIGLVQFFKLQ